MPLIIRKEAERVNLRLWVLELKGGKFKLIFWLDKNAV